jgi:hypothetical protein
METKENKNLSRKGWPSPLAAGVILIACIIVVWLAGPIQGDRKNYDIKPEITLPEYQTDTARAIDAYERMMDRFIDLTERNLTGINTDVKVITEKLNLIDYKLTELSTRMARIEKALGIEQVEKRVEKAPEAQTPTATSADKPPLQSQK